MLYFHNDYNENCHAAVLQRMQDMMGTQMDGYGMDTCCSSAAEKIRTLCADPDLAVHFLVGGTQTNLIVIDAALRSHQAALCAESGHINVHETGAVEATGHKVLTLPTEDGKITAGQIEHAVRAHRGDATREHIAQPKLVYISNPTGRGTIYSLAELEALREVRFPETIEAFAGFLFVDCPQLEAVWFPASARIVDIVALGTTADPNITVWVPAGSIARQVAEERGWSWKETPAQ